MDHVLWTAGVDGIIQDVVRAENCYLYDSRGTRYVDLEAGTWAASLGHNHPRVVRAIQTQASRLIHTGSRYASPVLEEAARAVLEVVGFRGGRCTFLSSGSRQRPGPAAAGPEPHHRGERSGGLPGGAGRGAGVAAGMSGPPMSEAP